MFRISGFGSDLSVLAGFKGGLFQSKVQQRIGRQNLGAGLRAQISGFGFRVSGFGLRVLDIGFQISSFGFRISGFESGDSTC